ncbi:pterin 4 alpha carbinolamine dehydratase-domain-containing protein [Phaeosphaeria sp. MPI-PUGE-AT-0046c]|nr:pterin 4 alpha carbinolamine dehydratase-domain-containing protein [Phaeosphaeria sp. MPI-PUGE-AT-0046c]
MAALFVRRFRKQFHPISSILNCRAVSLSSSSYFSPFLYSPTAATYKTMVIPLKVSEGSSHTAVVAGMERLCENQWELIDGRQLERTYHFKLHTKSVDLFNVIQVESKLKSHHAKIISEYCSLKVCWTTHRPAGLSEKDIAMADFSDEWAEKLSAVASTEAPRCG